MPEPTLKCTRCGGPAVRLVQTGALVCAKECSESVVHMAKRIVLQEEVGNVARTIGRMLPEGVGFAVVLFDFERDGSMSYASSAEREGMMCMLEELLDKMRVEPKR